jgi:HD-GYP domain-containing protein (c-di-GMP phosphodiesterase class II)
MSRVMKRTPAHGPAAQPSADYDRGGDSYIRRRGRDFIIALYSASRALKLYPLENAAVQNALKELTALAGDLLKHERELELRVSGEFIFINATRLRLDLDNYASFSRILAMFRDAGVGVCRVEEGATSREWTSLVTILQSATSVDAPARFAHVTGKLEAAGVRSFALSGPTEVDDDEFREKAKEAAKRTYAQSVTVTKEVINSVRMGRSPNIKKIKRAVQSIVDQILNEETSLLGLTTLRDYDEYTFTHSVNVCIFSVALGRKIGLTKLQLYDLGVAALLHDIGKSRVPLEILNKPDGLNDDEWRMMSAHPWLGVLALFQMRGQAELPYRAMVVAHEHHMKSDLTGYPKHLRERQMSIYSKIVAVADGFDAATSRRVYQTEPLTPVAVLAEMRNNPRRGMDPVIVKAFVSLVGHYPVGTLVVLDTFELAVVHAVNPVPEAISRPIVRVISDERGNLLHPGVLVDLNQQEAGTGRFLRTIIKLADPDRYGIRVSDYFA